MNDNQIADSLEIRGTNNVTSLTSPLVALDASIVLLKQFTMRHGLTQRALDDLVKLFHLSNPDMPASAHMFNRHFQKFKCNINVKLHYFCSFCMQLLSNCDQETCSNELCNAPLNAKGATSSFIQLPVDDQLSSVLQRRLNKDVIYCW